MTLSLAERIDPKTTALVVVDVQNDYCHTDSPMVTKAGLEVGAAHAMLPRLLNLVEAARAAGTMVVWVRMIRTEFTRSEVEREQRERMRPGAADICREGSWGAEFYRVEPAEGEPIVNKSRYSGFVDTNLDLILRSRGIKTLVFAGVATNVCVESTARDAFMRDYYVVLVEDCSAAYFADLHAAALRNIELHFGLVVKAADVFETWQPLLARV
jgi:ureidoacrylate peracid hydrolase